MQVEIEWLKPSAKDSLRERICHYYGIEKRMTVNWRQRTDISEAVYEDMLKTCVAHGLCLIRKSNQKSEHSSTE